MDTKQLFQIIVAAEGIHEASCDQSDPWKPIYTKTLDESLEQAFSEARVTGHASFPIIATEAEKQLASFLIREAWNDVQIWNEE